MLKLLAATGKPAQVLQAEYDESLWPYLDAARLGVALESQRTTNKSKLTSAGG
jgi:hypothetical protein